LIHTVIKNSINLEEVAKDTLDGNFFTTNNEYDAIQEKRGKKRIGNYPFLFRLLHFTVLSVI
jgi:hypothetical protein